MPFTRNSMLIVVVVLKIDKPWPPGRPTVTSLSRDTASLSWSAPRNDGGSPVTGYIVESKSSSYYAWTSCSVGVKIAEPQFAVSGLVEGTSYEFRVIAENRSGRSEPSPSSAPVIIRELHGQRWLYDAREFWSVKDYQGVAWL